MAEIITIASSTNNQSDKIKANMDKKFRVCHVIAIAIKVRRKTIGAASQATRASFIQIIKNKTIKTSKTVINQSLIR